MNTELTVIDPKQFGLEENQAVEITKGLTQILEERKTLSELYSDVIQLEITEQNISKFKELRLKIRDNRTKGIESWHKVNKEFYLRGGQFVDAIKRKEVIENERMEANLKSNEDYFENLEKERFEAEMKVRLERVHKFNTEVTLHDVRQFNDENFELFLSGVEKQYNDRVEAERISEEKRQAEIKAEQERIELQRLENERLKAEAEAREREIEAERKKQAIEQAKIKAEAEAQLEAERKESQRLQAELEAKRKAEAEAEQARLKADLEAKKEAEKLAKAPIKKQLKSWVDSFELPISTVDNDLSNEIISKFESFKKWSQTQIDSL